MGSRIIAVWLMFALVPACRARAQDALVLSGGGARGLAHVGVLLRLDELGYDPDIVVGNSMGAVIGALYAAGYEPEEIRRRIEAVSWSGVFSAMPVVSGPGQHIRRPMLSFDLNVAERRVSRGLFGEWRINRALAQLLFDANARARGDFDRLPRRYRALAADLATGRAVVIESGDLARAVRASMAYPGFFSPVAWDDQLLTDGGIVDNLPTLEARQLGASHIVAVDVTYPPDLIGSRAPLAVVQRSLNLMQRNLHRDTIAPDILIKLELDSNFAGGYFPNDPRPLIDAGYAAANRGLGTTDGNFASANPRTLPPPPDSISAIIVESPDAARAALVLSAFSSVAPGPYDADAIRAAMDRVYRTGMVEGIWPRIENAEDTARAPVLHVRLDPPAPATLSFAAGYDNDRGGRFWTSIDAHTHYGRHPALRTAAVSFTPLESWAALSTRIQSLSRPGLGWSIGAQLQERTAREFGEDVTHAIEVWRAGGWLGVELPIAMRSHFITAALRGEWIDPENGAGGAAFGPAFRFAEAAPEVPTAGEPLLLEAEVRWGDVAYRRFAARASYAFDVPLARVAAVGDVRGVSRNAPIDDRPALGDEHAVPGLRWGDQRGRARAVVGIDAVRSLFSGHARVRLRTGTVFEELDALDKTHWVTGGEIGVVWPIPFGALQAGWALATRGDGQLVLDIGRTF